MGSQELIDRLVEAYLAEDLPSEPVQRLGILHGLVRREWSSLPLPERVALAQDLDDWPGPPILEDHDALTDEERREFDETAIDGITDRVRAEFPELAVPEPGH
jgi:hypothetical protein